MFLFPKQKAKKQHFNLSRSILPLTLGLSSRSARTCPEIRSVRDPLSNFGAVVDYMVAVERAAPLRGTHFASFARRWAEHHLYWHSLDVKRAGATRVSRVRVSPPPRFFAQSSSSTS